MYTTKNTILILILALSTTLAFNCPTNNESPLLKIFIKPKQIVKGYKGNITVICNVRKRPGVSDPIDQTMLQIKTNKTLVKKVFSYETGLIPFNVSLDISYADFVNESSLVSICTSQMETRKCTTVQETIKFLDSLPTEKPKPTPKKAVSWHETSYGIVSLVIAVAALFIGVVISLLLYRRYKKGRESLNVDLDLIAPDFPTTNDGEESLPFPVNASNENQYSQEKVIEINASLSLIISSGSNDLGSGKFGSVVLGLIKYKDSKKENEKVAVKMLKDSENLRHRKDFEQEVQSLTGLDHPNIVRLLATHRDEENFYIVMEYLAKGSLLNLLHVDKKSFGTLQLIMFARDIACGMEYLASKMIVHRDLAARNILIGDDDAAKISDFGLARNIEETGEYVTSEGYVPLKWIALESLENRQFTVESDIWSYGIVLWEIFTFGQDPYQFMSKPTANIFDLRDFLKSGKRLEPPQNCPNGINVLMQQCWSPFPANRPSFTELKNATHNMLETFADNQAAENEE